ncbi:MAG: GNAT family N-acetyltransferase [bacterium]|nr:GNAT family N-acetyltransferase [bacterium]
MPDMLVKLYALPPIDPHIARQTENSITIRRGLVPEKHLVLAWIKDHFGDGWVNEADVAFARTPISIFVAVKDKQLIGFGCYDTTKLGFFGPTGVGEAGRGKGTGAALLLACLHDMWAQGYGYAVIGGVGPADFYTKIAGATLIPDSDPGVYAGLLKENEDD